MEFVQLCGYWISTVKVCFIDERNVRIGGNSPKNFSGLKKWRYEKLLDLGKFVIECCCKVHLEGVSNRKRQKAIKRASISVKHCPDIKIIASAWTVKM